MGKTEFQQIYSIAQSEIGYLEKKSASNLDSKTANAGYNNYTKYWRDIANCGCLTYRGISANKGFAGGPDWYWCAGAVFWWFAKALGVARACELLDHPANQAYILCNNLYNYGKAKGQIKTTPQAGDVVLFGSGSNYKHTGLVYNVDGTYFYTIEGNTSGGSSVVANGGGCCAKKYKRSSTKAVFFRPNYKVNEASSPVSDSSKNVSVTYLKYGSSGSAVTDLQNKLNKLGYNCGTADGVFGNKTLSAVKSFQKAHKLGVDGIVGPKTTAAINNAISKSTNGTTTSTGKNTVKFKGVVTGNGVNVRTWAGKNNGNIKSIPRVNAGRSVEVMDFDQKDSAGDTWYYVRLSGKYYGFIHSKYVRRV